MNTKHRYNTEITQNELVTAARALFAAHGYAAARTEEIVGATGLTRGALYHHFSNKKSLFQAVLEELQAELTAEVVERARAVEGDHIDRLRAGFHAYLDLALRDDVRQILFIDGPAVLGWEAWREIDLQHAFRLTQIAVERAMEEGEIDNVPVVELTHVLLGAVTHASLEVGRSEERTAAREAYGQVIDFLLDKLRKAD